MKLLLTNDDGIHASGLRSLASHLRAAGNEVTIIAPDSERSAASHSLTLRRDLRVTALGDNEYSVDGTPVDCVVIALQKILTQPVDLVISGINAGQNMGEDVLYSGTVGAAVEASFFGYRAIAISINSYRDQIFDTAAAWMVKMLEAGVQELIPPRGILNINIPNVLPEAIKGIRLTSMGHRKYYNFIKVVEEFADGFSYRIGGDLPVWDLQRGSDAEAISENYISITPLGFSLTQGDAFPKILEWLEANKLLQF